MSETHIRPLRLWEVLRRQSPLEPEEYRHFEACKDCRDFAREFVQLADALSGTGSRELLDILNRSPFGQKPFSNIA